MQKPLEKFLKYLRSQKALLYVKKDAVLLDIGCGEDFWFLKRISWQIRQGFGIDVKIKKANWRNLKIIRHDLNASDLPFDDNYFDCVTALAVLEHVASAKKSLAQIYRVLKPGGNLIMTVPATKAKPILRILAGLNLLDRKNINQHKRYFEKKDLQQILTGAGFKNTKHSYFQLGFNNFIHAKK